MQTSFAATLIKKFIKSARLYEEVNLTSMPAHIAYQKDGIEIIETLVENRVQAINTVYPRARELIFWYYHQEKKKIICYIFQKGCNPIGFSLEDEESSPVEVDLFVVDPELISCDYVTVH